MTPPTTISGQKQNSAFSVMFAGNLWLNLIYYYLLLSPLSYRKRTPCASYQFCILLFALDSKCFAVLYDVL